MSDALKPVVQTLSLTLTLSPEAAASFAGLAAAATGLSDPVEAAGAVLAGVPQAALVGVYSYLGGKGIDVQAMEGVSVELGTGLAGGDVMTGSTP